MTKPWEGRFLEPTDRVVERFTASIEADREIALEDIEGSLAHAKMLLEVGILSATEGAGLEAGLNQVRSEVQAGALVFDPALEDVHMNIERRLEQLLGADLAGRLHTGRSRNDQVALDECLYLRRKLEEIRQRLLDLESALVAQGRTHLDTLLPAYTHLQRAQPTRLAHHVLAHREAFRRDRQRIADLLERALISPLGAGAVCGTPHPIQRERVAELLGLEGVTRNSMDTVGDRDAILEALSAAAISMVHLSRLSEELVLWSTTEFSFCEISDAFTTGSSMMPQKKNPDVAELVRGKCGRVIGDLVALLVTMKGLPLTYNRDLQEDKPSLFDGLDSWSRSLEVMARMLPSVHFRADKMSAALADGFVTATELADHLTSRGVPFREAHHLVGSLVAELVTAKRTFTSLSLGELKAKDPRFGEDALRWIDPLVAVERRTLTGGPARAQVVLRLAEAEREIKEARNV